MVPITSTPLDVTQELTLQRTSGIPLVILVQQTDESGTAVENPAVVELAPFVNPTTVDLGYFALRVDMPTAGVGQSEDLLTEPVFIDAPEPPADGVIAFSVDGANWSALPLISNLVGGDSFGGPGEAGLQPRFKTGNTNHSQMGYEKLASGRVLIKVTEVGYVGTRKVRRDLSIVGVPERMRPWSALKLPIENQIGEGSLTVRLFGTSDSCTISQSLVLRARSEGSCGVEVTQSGDGMYMSSTSRIVMFTVDLPMFVDTLSSWSPPFLQIAVLALLLVLVIWQFVLAALELLRIRSVEKLVM